MTMGDVLTEVKKVLARIFNPRSFIMFGVGLILLIGIAYVFDTFLMPWYTKHGEALAVPNVVAKPYDDAKDLLEAQGLKVVKQGEKHHAKLPFGYVAEQNPRANRSVKKGRRIYLTISIGENEVEMPELVGLSETNAEEALRSLGLRVGDREYRYDLNELPKVVIEQSEPVGAFIKLSKPVDMVVSLGPPVDKVTVPPVFGKRLDEARLLIQKSGLTIGQIRYRRNSELLPNTVFGQSVESGTVVSPGDTLDLVVSTIVERN